MTGPELPPDDRPPAHLSGPGARAGGPADAAGPDAVARSGGGGSDRGRVGRRLVVTVAVLEAGLMALAAGVSVLAGLRGGSLALALGIAVAALATAYLLVEVARAFARGRRWPMGIFVTVQLLVALTALSVGAPALLSLLETPRPGGLTLLALLVSGAGLLGVALLWRTAEGPGGEDVPVL